MAAEKHPINRLDAEWLEAHWMPFTGNRNFKANPRIISRAEGVYYTSQDGRKIFDGLSGLWCCGLGHGRQEITDAARRSWRSWIIRRHFSSATRCRSSWLTESKR